MKPAAAVTKKPNLNPDAALRFASPEAPAETPSRPKVSGQIPEGDVRMTANIKASLHLKLKIEAAKRRTTIGELVESMIEEHFTEEQ